MTTSGLVQAVPSALAAILGFTGVIFGARVTSRGQYRQWLRQERLRLYSEYVSLAKEAVRVFSMEIQAESRKGSPESESQQSLLRAAWIEVDRALARISIVGGSRTRDHARQLARALAALLEKSLPDVADDAGTADWELAAKEVQKRIGEFRDSAARELGVDQ